MSAPVEFDQESALQHLQFITEGWSALEEDIVLEVRVLHPERGARDRSFDVDDLEGAVNWAAELNGDGWNAYVVVNPKRASARARAARDEDIVASFFHWADADDEEAVAALDGSQRSATVVTGAVPARREHVYWRLSQPAREMTQWRERQTAIAQRFGADLSVVNPSRIMRLAGSIAWPSKAKAKSEGRQPELVLFEHHGDHAFGFEDIVGPDWKPAASAAEAPREKAPRQDLSPEDLEWVDAARQETDRRLIDQLNKKRNVLEKREDWLRVGLGLHSGFVGTEWEEDAREAFIDWSCRWRPQKDVDPERLRRDAEKLWDRANEDGPVKGEPVTVRSAQALISQMPHHLPPEIVAVLETDDIVEDGEALRAHPLALTPFTSTPLDQIEPTPWLYDSHHQRGALTITAAPGGVGKSLLTIGEALAMASGRPLLGRSVHGQLRVLYVSGEEHARTLSQRVNAAMVEHDLKEEDLGGRLFCVSASALRELLGAAPKFVLQDRAGAVVDEQMVDVFRQIIRVNEIDVLILDPLKKFHGVDENDNGAMDEVADTLRQLADDLNIGVEVVHHGTKEARKQGSSLGAAGVRGASALVDASRSARVLAPMDDKTKDEHRIDEPDQYVEVRDAKANNAKKSPRGRGSWFRIKGVELGNGTRDYPKGDSVGVAVPWSPPAKEEGVEERLFLELLAVMQPFTGHRRESAQSPEWLGFDIAEALGLDVGRGIGNKQARSPDQNRNRALVGQLVGRLVEARVLVADRPTGNGRPVPVFTCDAAQLEELKKGLKPLRSTTVPHSPHPGAPEGAAGVGGGGGGDVRSPAHHPCST